MVFVKGCLQIRSSNELMYNGMALSGGMRVNQEKFSILKPERRFIQKKWSTLRHGGMNLRRIPGYGIRNINVLQAIKLFLLRHEERKRRRAYRE